MGLYVKSLSPDLKLIEFFCIFLENNLSFMNNDLGPVQNSHSVTGNMGTWDLAEMYAFRLQVYISGELLAPMLLQTTGFATFLGFIWLVNLRG